LVVVCAAMAGCGGASNQAAGRNGAGRYAADATFTMAIAQDFGSFDPYRNPQIKGYYKLAYDSLVNQRPDGRFVSGLAEKWSVDATSATFALRAGISCSDGTPLTASQVVADLKYAGDARNQSSLYGSQVPAVPFTATADDTTRTVTIRMKKPFGFLSETIGLTPIVCANALKNPKMLASASDGTGPFVLTRAVPGQSYTFSVRKGYTWGPGGASTSAPGTPAKVVLRVVPNQTTTANLLLSGELNFAQVSAADAQRLTARGVPKVDMSAPGAWLWLNQLGGRPTQDRRVRKALLQAVDLNEVIKVSTGGTGRAAAGLRPGVPNPCPVTGTAIGRLPAHDVAAAESLLDQAGWTKGANGMRAKGGKPLRLDLNYLTSLSPFERPTTELLAQRWKTIGVDVKISPDTDAKFSEVFYKTSNYDVMLIALGTGLPSAVVKYVSGPVPPKGNNVSGIVNKDYDQLAAKAETITPPTSCTYWNEAERALFRDVDIAPISIRYSQFFLHGAQAQVITYSQPIPTSIRMLG
jgi:peptide/nickel transport system substrate-binding protein